MLRSGFVEKEQHSINSLKLLMLENLNVLESALSSVLSNCRKTKVQTVLIPAHSSVMSWDCEMRRTAVIPPRPTIQDLRNSTGTAYQYGNTFNLFGIRSKRTNDKLPNLVLPMLHIKLGIGNNVVSVLDNAADLWCRNQTEVDAIKNNLARCFSTNGVHRKDYYSGTLPGRSVVALFQNMDSICDFFFHNDIPGAGNAAGDIEICDELEKGLR